jgi:RNA-directed DNA polymerase
MCLWKQWKKPKTKIKRLVSLGVPEDKPLNGVILAKGIGVLQAVQFFKDH